jgi:glycosyltransferase involved in cell wall biosynthesis
VRIALFTETFLPKIDGVVNTLCRLLSHLPDRGHEAILFAPSGAPPTYATSPVYGLRSYTFPFYPEIKLVPPTVNVSARLMAFRPDLIHLANPFALGLAGMRQAHRLGIPVIASYHTDIPGFLERWGYPRLAGPTRDYLRWIHNRMELNLCPSNATMAELHAQGFHRLKVWTRGVDTERYRPDLRTAEWRDRLTDGHPDSPLLLFVGRVAPEKRIDWLRPVMNANPQARLAVVGDGPARAKLETLLPAERTVFTGFLDSSQLAYAYPAGDIFVFPAINETFGNVILEAMACGLPVVAAAAGGPLDTVVDGDTGLLFEPFDQDGLVDAVTRLLEDQALAKRLSAEGRRYAEARSWSAVMDGLLDDYATVCRN